MEISGEDDQTNSAGARPIFNNKKNDGLTCTCPMLRRKSKIGGIEHTCRVITLEQERSERRPAPADSSEASGQSVQPSPPMPMQLMNTPCHAGVLSESNVPDHLWDWWNDDRQRQWLQVQPWNNADPWDQYGIVAPALETNKITVGISGIVGKPARGNDGGWSSRSQWYGEPKRYFDKSPPPEWDGNHPEKTWRDYRRTLKQWLRTTDILPEKTRHAPVASIDWRCQASHLALP